MHKKINTFVKCIDEKRFYDAHEALEEIWFPRRFEGSSEVKLLKGFINASVSFELRKRSREKQSKKVWANYLKYRQFLLRTDSKYIHEFYSLSRYIEDIHRKKDTFFSVL